MPWCGSLGVAGTGFWWVVPLIGLVIMALMCFACFRGFGCMGGRRRASRELSDVRRELESLREDVRMVSRHPD